MCLPQIIFSFFFVIWPFNISCISFFSSYCRLNEFHCIVCAPGVSRHTKSLFHFQVDRRVSEGSIQYSFDTRSCTHHIFSQCQYYFNTSPDALEHLKYDAERGDSMGIGTYTNAKRGSIEMNARGDRMRKKLKWRKENEKCDKLGNTTARSFVTTWIWLISLFSLFAGIPHSHLHLVNIGIVVFDSSSSLILFLLLHIHFTYM